MRQPSTIPRLGTGKCEFKKNKKNNNKENTHKNPNISNILCNEHKAVFSARIQTHLYLLQSNVDIYLDKCTRIQSYSYMENRNPKKIFFLNIKNTV